MEHELAARSAGIGGDDRSLDAELIRSLRLAFADALDLWRLKGIELPPALTLALRANLIGAREGHREHGFEFVLSSDLAADVAQQASKPGAQETQLPMVPLESLGMGVAPSHHRGASGNAQIGFAQLQSAALR